jgi:hypothetical protein
VGQQHRETTNASVDGGVGLHAGKENRMEHRLYYVASSIENNDSSTAHLPLD